MAKKPSQSPKKNDPSFPGLQPAGKSTPAKTTQYEERQQDEVTALKAIYTDDFVEHKAAHSAWKVGFSPLVTPLISFLELSLTSLNQRNRSLHSISVSKRPRTTRWL